MTPHDAFRGKMNKRIYKQAWSFLAYWRRYFGLRQAHTVGRRMIRKHPKCGAAIEGYAGWMEANPL